MNPSPAIKFLKSAVPYIISGQKTLEPRPRSLAWIKRLQKAKTVNLTYGPRMGRPTVFAVAHIEKIEIRPLDTVTREDLSRIGYGWETRALEEFTHEYGEWYRKELHKGYPVVWIYFSVIEMPQL